MTQIKTIDKNGQIFLGKEFVGERVLIDNIEPGVWIVKIGKFIPNNEQWLHQKDHATKLDEALIWAANSEPLATDLTELESKLLGEDN